MKPILRGQLDRRQPGAAAGRSGGRLRRIVQQTAFATLYGPAARVYDRFTHWLFLGEWERWQAAVLPFLPDEGRILELGSGTGALAARAVSTRRRWCCLEASAAMIDVSRKRCRRTGALLVRGDARSLPFASGAFDAVAATFPTAYVLAAETHREAQRAVRPGGTLAIVLTGRLAPDGLARNWRARLLHAFYGRGRDEDPVDRPPPEPAGFTGSWRWVQTGRGEALLYVGVRRASDPVG